MLGGEITSVKYKIVEVGDTSEPLNPYKVEQTQLMFLSAHHNHTQVFSFLLPFEGKANDGKKKRGGGFVFLPRGWILLYVRNLLLSKEINEQMGRVGG